ncbi:MAG: IS110 family transposase [Firmicutes bacterium]|nr:IS110 family transposase [Bacillota bacterium]
MPNSLLVGIDVSSCDNKVRVLDSLGNSLSKFTVSNNYPGARILADKITGIMTLNQFDSLVIGLESTSVYGEPLVHFLKQDADIGSFKPHIHVLNPKQVHAFKKAYPDLPKTDDVDAWIIAENLRFGRINQEVYMDDKIIALRKLTRARFYTARNLTREKNHFLNHLFLKFSSLTQEKVFSDKFGATSLAVVEEFLSVDEIAYMSIEELSAFVYEKSKGKFSMPDDIAKLIQKAARSSYRLPKTVNDSVNQVLAISLIAIRALKDQLRLFDKAIEEQMKVIPNTLTSVKGIGPVYAAGIIAEIGDIGRFKNHAALAKFAGICWSKYQSGKYTADNTRLISSGNRYLRYYLMEAANKVRVHDPEFKRFYDLKYRETPKTPHKRALALTARKLVRLVYALLRSNRLYIPPAEH